MPRIYDEWLDSVVYLYPSADAAKRGDDAGGCGFLMSVPSETNGGSMHIYAVTNSHVIREGRSPVVRLNTARRESDVLELEEDDWTHHPHGDDIAVALIDLPQGVHRTNAIQLGTCLIEYLVKLFSYGPGDEVFTISRFITQDGKQSNQPVVRFGNIAKMAGGEKRPHPRGYSVDSFLVESRSVAGMSGSPVFIYIPYPEVFRPKDMQEQMLRGSLNGMGPYLLGIDWGHLTISEAVVDAGGKDHDDGWRVNTNSGFMAVAPAWKISDLLKDEGLVAERESPTFAGRTASAPLET